MRNLKAVDAVLTHLTAEAAPGEAGDQVLEFTTGEHKAVICNKVNISGAIIGETANTVTVEPKYEECGVYQTKAGGTSTETSQTEKLVNATLSTTGCHYEFTGETVSGNPTGGEHAVVNLRNFSGCEHIKIKVSALNTECIDVLGEQSVNGVRYNNIEAPAGKEAIEVKATVHGITSTTTSHPICPTTSGQTEVHNNGSYVGSVIVKGYSDEAHEHQVNITTTVP